MLPKNIVCPNGTLNDKEILKREILYKCLNGKYVERFYLSRAESYVFKPLTNSDQVGKELWANEQLLPFFSGIYPHMIAYSANDNPNLNWIIFEDLGPLTHLFNEEIVLEVTKLIAWWHAFPIERLENIPLTGPKPTIEEMAAEISIRKNEFLHLLPLLQLEEKPMYHIYSLLEQGEFPKNMVISHGDLHLGNYAVVNNKTIILDWEHAHLNTPCWDLYHVIDMSHPLFPKKVTSQLRVRILNFYLDQLELNGKKVDGQAFLKEYYLFSSVFSIWMIFLIRQDLFANGGKWSKDQLEIQLKETITNLSQCAGSLIGKSKVDLG
jgi:thiamine kinase-like enzyme